jgi:RNase H-like domain found in reverse transcriptase/Integrase zinc binding domain
MSPEGSAVCTEKRKELPEPGSGRQAKGLDPGNDVSIYAIQINHPFEDNSFIFLFDEAVTDSGGQPESFSKPVIPYNLSKQRPFRIGTLYKRKADKVRPVDLGVSTGESPSGKDGWLQAARQEMPASPYMGKYKGLGGLTGRFSSLQPGSRLTKERSDALIVGDELTVEEKELLLEVLTNREEALAFDWTHCGTIRPEVAPPQEIRTIDHKAWQTPNFPVPRALMGKVVDMLKERLERGTMEYSQGPYRNPWFLVAKKEKGEYRLVVAAMKMNGVTVRDGNLPPQVDEFAEEFAGCTVASLIDFFSGYDQALLALKSRDMTAFSTPIGLLRMTRLPQGATNSVAQFVRIVQTMLHDIIPDKAKPYMDDVGVKGPKTYYGFEEIVPGIRRFMLEHIRNLDATLERIERAGATIGPKSQFCMPGLKLVGFVTDADGRHPPTAKIIKILEWPPLNNAREVREFLGVCVFYRIWVKNFGVIAEPLYRLLKKDVPFEFGMEQELAMAALKKALTEAPGLVSLDYSDEAGKIILTVDASLTGWGAVLQQLDTDKKRHPVRFESGLWTTAERNYDATKRECRGALKAIKKMRSHLIGVHFVLETDAAVLVAQLNKAATDLPGALLTRWIAWMRLFDFEVKFIPGKKNTAADGLSRKKRTPSDDVDDACEVDIDDWIALELNAVAAVPRRPGSRELTVSVSPAREADPLGSEYSKASQRVARFLRDLKRPIGMDRKEFFNFKNKALLYSVVEKELYKRGSRGMPMRLVVDDPIKQREIIQQCHVELGHKGRESTYRRVANAFFWEGCYVQCKGYVLSCVSCQKREANRIEEPMHPTYMTALWAKVTLDVTYLPKDSGKRYLVVAREDLSGWPEARPLVEATSEAIADFIWEEIVCRHGVFGKLVVDGGPENKGAAKAFTTKYGIHRIQISAYNSKANGGIERGHRSIGEALARMSGGGRRWIRNLSAVLLAERTSIHAPTGVTPFSLIYGREAVLPYETRFPVWRLLDWKNVRTRDELLELRARQLQLRDEDMEEIALRKRRFREQGKEAFDANHHLRLKAIKAGDVVLVYHSKRAKDMTADVKLGFRWMGPYRIKTAFPKSYYKLEEMDGVELKGTYAGNRLKKFIYKKDAFLPVDPDSEDESDNFNQESDSWEGDSVVDENLPRSLAKNQGLTAKNDASQIQIIPPSLTDAEKAQYTLHLPELTPTILQKV